MNSMSRLSLVAMALAGITTAAAAAPLDEQKLAYKFGRCLVERDRQAAVQLLNRLPLERGEVDLVQEDSDTASPCLPAGVTRLSAMSVRGGIAQELFLRDFQEFGVEPRRKGEYAELSIPTAASGPATDAKTQALYALGDCVVRNRTGLIDGLLNTSVGSKLERKLIDKLTPIMSACHASQGQARVSRADLRSLLAQAAYVVSVRYWTGRLKPVLG